MTHKERIANGECVSKRGVDDCPFCTDRCEAFHWSVEVSDAMVECGIKIQSTGAISNGIAMEEHPGLK